MIDYDDTIVYQDFPRSGVLKPNAKEVIDFESFFLNKLKEFKYTPKENFGGRTECFTFESKNKIYEHFKQH